MKKPNILNNQKHTSQREKQNQREAQASLDVLRKGLLANDKTE